MNTRFSSRTRPARLAVALSGLWLAAAAAAQTPDFDQIEITSTEITDGLWLLSGAGGNVVASVGADGVLLIDDEWQPMAGKLRAAVEEIADQPPRVVLNTHWHMDHAGGNQLFGEAGAVIIAHDNVRARLREGMYIEFFDMEVPPSPPAALPVVTFDDAISLHFNGDTIRVQHVGPAHTDGDAVAWFTEADVLHIGDIFFNGMYPYIDDQAGGNVRGVIAAIDALLPEIDDDMVIVPGHGAVADRAALVRYRDMLQASADSVQALIDAGRSREEIIAAKPTAELDADWGQGFIPPDGWVTLLCRSLDCP